jgi:hypothetical protein
MLRALQEDQDENVRTAAAAVKMSKQASRDIGRIPGRGGPAGGILIGARPDGRAAVIPDQRYRR